VYTQRDATKHLQWEKDKEKELREWSIKKKDRESECGEWSILK
jgi:hypothetical protein